MTNRPSAGPLTVSNPGLFDERVRQMCDDVDND
jgi:hypothetical protein